MLVITFHVDEEELQAQIAKGFAICAPLLGDVILIQDEAATLELVGDLHYRFP